MAGAAVSTRRPTACEDGGANRDAAKPGGGSMPARTSPKTTPGKNAASGDKADGKANALHAEQPISEPSFCLHPQILLMIASSASFLSSGTNN